MIHINLSAPKRDSTINGVEIQFRLSAVQFRKWYWTPHIAYRLRKTSASRSGKHELDVIVFLYSKRMSTARYGIWDNGAVISAWRRWIREKFFFVRNIIK
jgi:hypothetical protein